MLIFDGQNINPNSNPIVANNAEFYTFQFDDDDGFFGLDDQDDTVTIINVTDPNNPVVTYTDVSFSFEGTGVFPPNAQPPELAGREVAVIDVLDGSGNVIDSFFFFIDDGGQTPIANGNSRLNRSDLDITPTPICFADDVMIATPNGLRLIQTIRAGDQVLTASGPQEVIHATSTLIDSLTQILSPNVRKVVLRKGAFGPNLPSADLKISQQHRLMFSGSDVEMLFGSNTVFAPAKAFVNGKTIVVEPAGAPFSYHHITLAEHTSILAEGMEAETLFVGDVAESVLPAEDLEDIRKALRVAGASETPQAGGVLLSMSEAKVLSAHLSAKRMPQFALVD